MARRVDIVPHTHWDREWYRPFQSFRLRLVDLLDDLLDRLDSDPGYAHFMLDGQMAVVDDYLAIRPEEEDRIRRLAGSGRLSLGPWYILMDEFLVSGETIVRDMEMGLDRAARFGGAMELGYLPDMFGHIAQMPQILAGFGFDETMVWRGVPAAIDAPAFLWQAPDGTEVMAEYLADGYSNGAVLPADAKELLARISDWAEAQEPRSGDPVLWMNGTDHLMPQAALGRLVAEADELSDDWDLRVCSLADHVAARVAGVEADGGRDALPVWTGEMRSGARTNVLMGVTSNRMDVRQRAARAERGLERTTEPLWALFAPRDEWPQAFLDEAWGLVVRNAAHDSICACSVDPVVDAVLHRYDESRDVSDGLTSRALRRIGTAAGGDGPVIVNPSARVRHGVVELTLDGDEPPAGAQVQRDLPGRRRVDSGSRANLGEVVNRVLDRDADATDVEITDDGSEVTVVVGTGTGGLVDRAAVRARVAQVMAAGAPDSAATVWRDGPTAAQVLLRTAVDGFSWRRWAPAPLDVDPVTAEPLDGGGARVANGRVAVEIDPTDGTWSIDGVAGYGRLVDGGDMGDTYNWCPPEDGDTLVDRPDAVRVEVIETGPVRARAVIATDWTLPLELVANRRADVSTVATTVVTTLTLHAGEALLRVETTIDNRSRDHRLRVHHPLPRRAAASAAGSAYATVTRGTAAEGGPTEAPLPTFPARDHVTAGGLSAVVEGIVEYELVDVDDDGGAGELALTLLRCTGLLSQGPMSTRPVPAGPVVAAPGAQMPGVTTVPYGLAVDAPDPMALADDLFSALLVATPRGPHRGDGHTALAVAGAEVAAVRRRGGQLEVRVWNPSAEETTVSVDRTGWRTDLRGRPLERIDGPFPLRGGGIATLALDD